MIAIVMSDETINLTSDETYAIEYHTKLAEIATSCFVEIAENVNEEDLKIGKKEYMDGLCLTMLEILAKKGVINERKDNGENND